VAPAEHHRSLFHGKRTHARLGQRQVGHKDFLDLRIYQKAVPRDTSEDRSASRIDFRWDFIPGRDQISVRLTLGLRKLPKASRSLQRAWIRVDEFLPRLCQTPPRGPDRLLITPCPSGGIISCVALANPGHPPKGGVPRYSSRGVLHECSRHVSGSCRGPWKP